MNGKTIRIHLVNGLPSEILTAEIINWTGKIIVAPRSMLAELAKREEVKRTGVYCLLGPDPENPARDKVYVGEGDNVFKRLTAHDDDESKEFWVRSAVIISKDQNITKSHGRYIESRLITLAEEGDRSQRHCPSHPTVARTRRRGHGVLHFPNAACSSGTWVQLPSGQASDPARRNRNHHRRFADLHLFAIRCIGESPRDQWRVRCLQRLHCPSYWTTRLDILPRSPRSTRPRKEACTVRLP
jgi:hypothetical protein